MSITANKAEKHTFTHHEGSQSNRIIWLFDRFETMNIFVVRERILFDFISTTRKVGIEFSANCKSSATYSGF